MDHMAKINKCMNISKLNDLNVIVDICKFQKMKCILKHNV